jgi:serine/threonine protein kinase
VVHSGDSEGAIRNRVAESFPQLEFPDGVLADAKFPPDRPLLLSATTHADRTPVSLQFITHRFLEGTGNVESFRQRVSRFAALRHPNIAPILDFGEVDGGFYLISEAPEPTESVMARSLPAQEWVEPVADAMATARSFGISLRFEPELAWMDERQIPTFVPLLNTNTGKFPDTIERGGFAINPPRLELQAGDEIGSYVIIDKLGEGGFSEVWLADQTDPIRRKVALKFPKAGMDTRRLLARFEAEQQTLARLDHPSIAKIYDAGATESGRPFFVMEPVPGQPITEFCEGEKRSLKESLRVYIEVCRAAHHAHQKGIIHRDLKPANILVAINAESSFAKLPGVPKIIDYGIAKAVSDPLSEEPIFTRHDQLIGTPEYMSPEQAAYGNDSVDSSTDVYALGAILYEVLTGVPPFVSSQGGQGSAATENFRRRILEELPIRPSRRMVNRRSSPTTWPGRLPCDLDWITLKCLEKEPSRRYASASSLADDLERFLNDEPVTAGSPQMGYRLRKFVHRNRAGVIAFSLVLAALLSGFLLAMSGYRNARQSEAEAREETRLKDEEVALRVAQSAKTNRAITAIRDILIAPGSEDLRSEAYTAKQLLDDFVASGSFEALQDDPEAEVRIVRALRDAYGSLNLFEESTRHQRRLLELQTLTLGAESVTVLTERLNLGRAFSHTGRFGEAETILREVVQDMRRLLPKNHSTIPEALYVLGGNLQSQTKLDKNAEAEGFLREAWILFQAQPSAERNDDQDLNCGETLAAILLTNGKSQEALKLHEEIEIRWEQRKGASDPRTIDARIKTAAVYADSGDLNRAKEIFEDCLSTASEYLDENHYTVARAAGYLGIIYRDSGDFVEAEALHRRALRIWENYFPGRHHSQTKVRANLAKTLLLQDHLDEAESLFREALEISISTVGTVHQSSRESLEGLLSTLAAKGAFRARSDGTETIFENLAPSADHEILLRWTAMLLFNEYHAQESAVPIARRSLHMATQLYGAEHPRTFESGHLLARVLWVSLKTKDAIDSFQLCHELLATAESAQEEVRSTWTEKFLLEIELLTGSIMVHSGRDATLAWLHARMVEKDNPERARNLDRLALIMECQRSCNLGLIEEPQPVPLALISSLQRDDPDELLEETVIPRQADWQYSIDQNAGWAGRAWIAPEYDSADWKTGPAALGFGDFWHATEIETKDLGILAARFRTHFRLDRPEAVSGLRLLLRVDDGAVVYLNGKEVLRFNLPSGTPGATTTACESISKMREGDWRGYWLDSSYLREGENTLAISVHQSSLSSSDLSLGAELTAFRCRLEPKTVMRLLNGFEPEQTLAWLSKQNGSNAVEIDPLASDWRRRVLAASHSATNSWKDALRIVEKLQVDEEQFTQDHKVRLKASLLEKLGRTDDARSLIKDSIPARPPGATARQIDLTPFYNALLAESVMADRGGFVSKSVFAKVSMKPQTIGDVSFDVRGLIQIFGAGGRGAYDRSKVMDEPLLAWPRIVRDIPIGHFASHLHFLHANAYEEDDGTMVGRYRIHFADGTTSEIPLQFGRDIHNYHGLSDQDAEGVMSLRFDRGKVRLWGADVFSWSNPKPDVGIRSVDFVSGKEAGRPFLLAITSESKE